MTREKGNCSWLRYASCDFFLAAAGALLQEVLELELDDVNRDGADGAAAGGIDWTPRVPPPPWEVDARAYNALREFEGRWDDEVCHAPKYCIKLVSFCWTEYTART